MDIREFCELTLEKAKAAGITPAETYASVSDKYDITILKAAVDDASVKQQQGVGLRGLFAGKQGSAYTEALTPDAADTLVRGVLQTASVVDDSDEQPYFAGQNLEPFDPYNPAVQAVTPAQMIALGCEIEAAALAADKRVTRCSGTYVMRSLSRTTLMNSLGVSLEKRDGRVTVYCDVVAEAEGRMYNAGSWHFSRDPGALCASAIGKESAGEAVATIGAKPGATARTQVVFRNDVMADFLATFASALSAEDVQRGLSCLKGKLHEKIGADIVTLREEPRDPAAYIAHAFDDEGVPTAAFDVIKNGTLATYLHNLKTAKKDGVSSTANAARAGYKGRLSVYPANLTLLPGTGNADALIRRMGEGLFVTSLSGAGSSTTTGEFSLLLRGFAVRGGQIAEPVENMTLAGTLIQTLSSIRAIGADTFRYHMASAPSVLIEGLSAAGT